jgi:pimeloyl-ACP methyl ester carboxylesterase
MWAGTADSLARDFRVIVPDLRGFGLSTKLGDPAQYGRKMVADMKLLLDHLEVPSVHVMGYSMGGVIAAHLALDDPARVRTATFVAGTFWPDSVTAARILRPYSDSLAAGDGLGPFFRWILPTWSNSAVEASLPALYAVNDSASLVASLRALPALMLDWDRVKRARVPALAIVSVKDRVWEQSRFVAARWPDVKLVELETHDHSDIFLAPELVTEFRKLVR